MSTLKEQARNLLDFDALDTAEHLTGHNYKDEETDGIAGFGPTAILGIQLLRNAGERKDEVLSELGDTHNGMSWEDFRRTMREFGFLTVLERRFPYETFQENKWPEFVILAHPTKYLLITATSWIGTEDEHINGGKCYGCVEVNADPDLSDDWKMFRGCSFGLDKNDADQDVWSFDKDIREGLLLTLSDIGEKGKFVPWHQKDRFLWLLDYGPDKKASPESVEPYGHEFWRKRRDEFLHWAGFNAPWVRKFITDSPHRLNGWDLNMEEE